MEIHNVNSVGTLKLNNQTFTGGSGTSGSGSGDIDSTGNISCENLTVNDTASVGDIDISSPAGDLKLKCNSVGSVLNIEGSAPPTNLPTHIDSTEKIYGTASTIWVCDKPAGVEENDLLLAVIVTKDAELDPVNSVPEGWNLVVANVYASVTMVQHIYYKFATSSEGTNYTFGFSTSVDNMAGSISAFRYVDLNTPIGDYDSNYVGSGSGNRTAPSIDTTVENELVLHLVAENYGSIWTSPPSGYVEMFDCRSGSNNNYVTDQGSYKLYSTTGATGTASATTVTSWHYIATHMALKPFLTGEPSTLIKADPSGATELYHAGTKALETTATNGINVTGEVTASSIDTTGSITATTFHGDGSNLTGLPAGSVTAGWVLHQTIDATSEIIDATCSWNASKIKVEWHGLLTSDHLHMQFNEDSDGYGRGLIVQDGGSTDASCSVQTSVEIAFTTGAGIESWQTVEFLTGAPPPGVSYLYGTGKWSRYISTNTDNCLGVASWRWDSGGLPVTTIKFFTTGACSGRLKIYKWVE